METVLSTTACFVRDNPFFKNDARRLVRRPPVSRSPAPLAPREASISIGAKRQGGGGIGLVSAVSTRTSPSERSPTSPSAPSPVASTESSTTVSATTVSPTVSPLPESVPARMTRTQKVIDESRFDTVSIASVGSDIEYGPGIVEKLKAKFHRLSGLVSRDAKVSIHASGKRCPSMDDILSTADDAPVHIAAYEPQLQQPVSPLSKMHSQSTNDVFGGYDEDRPRFTVHRTVNIDFEEEPEAPTISTLRRKFEINVNRTPSQNMRYARARQQANGESRPARPASMDLSHVAMMSLPPEEHDVTFTEPYAISGSSRTVVETETNVRHIPSGATIVQVPPPNATPSTPIISSSNVSYAEPTPLTQKRQVELHRTITTDDGYTQPLQVPRVIAQSRPTTRSTTPATSVAASHRVRDPTPGPRPVVQPTHTDEEPEFVKIGRRLRRSSIHLEEVVKPTFEVAREDPAIRVEKLEEKPLVTETKKYAFSGPKPVELPSLSTQARITATETKFEAKTSHHTSMRADYTRPIEISNPPDPDSARWSMPSPLSPPSVRTDDTVVPAADASPPPEEPKPPHDLEEVTPHVNRPADLKINTSALQREIPSYPCLLSPPPILPKVNDDSGVNEMHKLLDRFQQTKGNKLWDIEKNEQEAATQFIYKTNQQRAFVSSVGGMRGEVPHSATTRPAVLSISVRKGDTEQNGRRTDNDHVVRRVEDDASSTTSIAKRVAPSPPEETVTPVPVVAPVWTPTVPVVPIAPAVVPMSTSSVISAPPTTAPPPLPVQTAPTSTSVISRKSLSAQYREEKAQQAFDVRREKPYGDDVTEIRSEHPKESSIDGDLIQPEEVIEAVTPAPPPPVVELSKEIHIEEHRVITSADDIVDIVRETFASHKDSDVASSESEDDDEEVTERPGSISFSTSLIAGDGNPVRHSLLSLVMEEDIPALLEAMSERYQFVFEDLTSFPSTSSIIHPMEKRQQRRKDRKVSNIRFQPAAPAVYTYLDEVSAITTQQWIDGAEVDYQAYQNMLSVEKEEYENQLAELERWRKALPQSNVPDRGDALRDRQDSLSDQSDEVSSDYAIGVTSRIAYSHSENSTIPCA